MKIRLIRYMLVVFVATAAVPVWADETGVVATMAVQKVSKDAKGREVLGAGDEARPGDVIEYAVTYENRGRGPVTGIEATVPIPPDAEYLPSTAKPVAGLASLDGVRYAPIPLTRVVKSADGSERRVPVPFVEYRSLRWQLGSLAAGHHVTVRARVRVSTTPSDAEKGISQ